MLQNPKKALRVVRQSYNYLDMVICVDDCCPLNTGKEIENNFDDKKILYYITKKIKELEEQ